MEANDTEEQVVFDKNSNQDGGELTHKEMWDDSLLIQHYDKTMNMARRHLANKLPSVSSVTDSECSNSHRTELVNGYSHSKVHSSSSGVKKKKKKRGRKKNEWHIGDPCRAIFDGEPYEATIVGINNAKGTCIVRYVGYNNHEDVIQSSLLKSNGGGARRRQLEAASFNEVDRSSEGSNDIGTDGESEMERETSKYNQQNRDFNMERGPSTTAKMHTRTSHPNPISMQPEQSFPHIPNLPPPPALGLVGDGDPLNSEALHTMLMSWYMTGYHTGYYQGLTHSRNLNSNKKSPNKKHHYV